MLRSFRSALIVFFLTVALLPALAVSVPLVWHIYGSTRDGALRELRLTSDRFANELGHSLRFAAARFHQTARDKDVAMAIASPFFSTRASESLEEVLRDAPPVLAALLLDAQLEPVEAAPEVVGASALRPLQDAVRGAVARDALVRNQAVWLRFDDPVLVAQLFRANGIALAPGATDGRVLALVAPMSIERYTRQAKVEGYLVSLVPVAALRRQAQAVLGREQSIDLLDARAGAPAPLADRQSAAAQVEGSSAAGPLPRLMVRISEPDSVRFAGLYRTFTLLAVAVVLALALTALGAVLLGRRLARPLVALERMANAYAEGRYDVPAARSDFVEFRRVALTLGDMARRIAHQIGELRNANQQLQQADKLKDDFLANTSHELRTPLHGIIGIASSLLDGAAGDLPAKVYRNVRLIEQSGRRLETLVNDILDFAKIKNRALTLERRPVELSSLVDIVLSVHDAAARRAGLRLVNAVPTDLPPAHADEFRLQQVLHNLVGNALKFTPEGSVTVSAALAGDWLRLSVADTGIGIPADRLEQVFDPFVQVDSASTRSYAGTGLGLSISRQLVELHGGTLEVACPEAGGAVFSLTLPVAHGEQAVDVATLRPFRLLEAEAADDAPHAELADAPAAARLPALPRHEASVLIVDDEPINLEILGNYFFNEPYTLHRAGSGQEALELLTRLERVDLILLDVMMPKMSGFEVCRRVREDRRFDGVAILFLTAREQAQDIHEGFALGANDYLIKPVSRIELLTRCQYHIHYGRVKNELAALNQSLEQKVEARTTELQQTLAIIQRNSDVFRALLEISIELQANEDLEPGVGSSLARLAALYPGRGFAVLLAAQGERVCVVRGMSGSLATLIEENWAVDEGFPHPEWMLAHNVVALPLMGPRRMGLGRLLAWPAALDQHEREVVELYGRQLAAVAATRRLQDELERIALTDALTGAYNRRHFEQTLQQFSYALQRAPERHFCLISVDVNGLKTANDRYGHEAGDALIRAVVALMRKGLRQSDIVCRVGGDEFAILAQDATLEACARLVERLDDAQQGASVDVETPAGRVQMPVSFSIGYASTEETRPEELHRVADLRMYAHKQAFYARRVPDADAVSAPAQP